jgi:hypothetical protein
MTTFGIAFYDSYLSTPVTLEDFQIYVREGEKNDCAIEGLFGRILGFVS